MKLGRLGVMRLLWPLVIAVQIAQPLLPQSGGDYHLVGEDGNIEISETGEISWVIGKGLSAYRYRLDLELDRYPKIDRIHKYGWTGAARHFLISSYKLGRDRRRTTLLLVAFHRDPARVEILSQYQPSFEVRDFAYYYPEQALFLLDASMPVISRVEMAADAREFPSADLWREILDDSKLPGASRNEAFSFVVPPEGGLAGLRVSTGSSNCAGGTPTVSRLVNADGHWRAELIHGSRSHAWGPPSSSVSIAEKLAVYLAGPRYRLVRLDLPGGLQEVMRGKADSFECGMGELFEIATPRGLFIPGARYALVSADGADEYEPGKFVAFDQPWTQEFLTLHRRGQVFEPDSLRVGNSLPLGRSCLGNGEYRVRVPVSAVGRDWWQRSAEVWLYWAMAPENAPPLAKELGAQAIFDPMGAVGGDRLKFNQGRQQNPEIALPLTDVRMAKGEMLYMQILVRSEEEIALSDVFATTIFPAAEGTEFELVEAEEIPELASECWKSASRRLSKELR